MQTANLIGGPITATTSGFQWGGGVTAFIVVGHFASSLEVALQKLGPDNATWVDVNVKTADGRTIHDLETGTYRVELDVGTSSGIYYELARIIS